MRKFLAFLLTLTMVMQLVALPVAGAEEVTTPTDLQLPCEACGGIAVLEWVAMGNGEHIKACPHNVMDESSRHGEYDIMCKFVSNGEESHDQYCGTCGIFCGTYIHWTQCFFPDICVECGQKGVIGAQVDHDPMSTEYKFDEKSHWRECANCGEIYYESTHIGSCANPELCIECGQSGVTIGYVDHNVGEQWQYDENRHWKICEVCQKKVYDEEHGSPCTGSLACAICGQIDVNITSKWHSMLPAYQYDQDYHWNKCRYCGEERREPHTQTCDKPGLCISCGQSDVNFQDGVSHWWKQFGEYEFNSERHWAICTECGEEFSAGVHSDSCKKPGTCVACGHSDVTISETEHFNCSDEYEYDDKEHWFICLDCGEKTMIEEHTPAADDLTKCETCGATIYVENPTEQPTTEPTEIPTEQPTVKPTDEPTVNPTEEPTAKPTDEPTAKPTDKPTASPTEQPTVEPTEKPTETPTEQPTAEPTEAPTAKPTKKPAPVPTEAPAHEHTFDIAFVSNNDGTHSKTCLGNCGEVQTEPCHLVTTDMGMMTCTACATCGYAVYTAKEGVAALTEGENVPAKVVRIETAAIAPAAEDAPEAVPADTQLLVHETTFDVPVALSTELKGTVEKVFTATLVKDGETIQPTGKVKLTIPVEKETLAALEGKVLMLMREDGTLIELEYEIIDGEIVFLTDELGVFLLMTPEA